MTRKTKRYIFLTVLLVLVAGVTIGYRMWNKPFKDALSGDAIVITAEQLLKDFSADEAKAREKYVPKSVGDKILEITGQVKEVGANAEGETFYILKAGGDMSGVKCIMEKQEGTTAVKAGQTVKIRGFCNGYLADEIIPDVAEVIVNRCKLVTD
jgi:hypothetical protein